MTEYTGAVESAPIVLPRQWPDLAQPGALEQIGAGLQLENTVVGGLFQKLLPPPEEQPFKSEWDVRDVVSFDEFMSGRFDNARDDGQVEAIRANINREKQLRDTMARGPLAPIVVGLFAAGVDPFTYIGPMSAPFRTLGMGGRFLAGAADAGLGMAASETVLSTQNLRSGSEALASMLMGTIFGGVVTTAMGRGRGAAEFGDPIAPTPRYTNARDELATYIEAVAKGEGSFGGPMSSTAVGRFMDSPTMRWTFERHPPPPGVIDDANLLRFAMGRSTRLFDEVEAAAAKIEALDNPLSLAIANTSADLTASRLERDGLIARIVDLEGRNNPAARAARAEGRGLDEVLAAMDAAPSTRKDPVATAQAAALRQRLAELDGSLPVRVGDEGAVPLTWQVNKARDAAIKEYQAALAKLHAQLDRERAKMAKLTQNLGKEGLIEAHGKIMELKDALARGAEVDAPKANWMDIIAAENAKKNFDDKAKAAATQQALKNKAEAPPTGRASPTAAAKGENIDFLGLCGGL